MPLDTCGDYPGGKLSIISSSAFSNIQPMGGINGSASKLFYTPVISKFIRLHDGTDWVKADFGNYLEMGTSASNGFEVGKNYDAWCCLENGVPKLRASQAWTNNTTRAEGISVTDGVVTKTDDITKRYIGTFRLNTTGGVGHNYGQRFLWNLYHQRQLSLKYVDPTSNWEHNIAAWRQARGQAAAKVEFVVGMDDALVDVTMTAMAACSLPGQGPWMGMALDSLTPVGMACNLSVAVANDFKQATTRYADAPGQGYHYLSWNEWGNAAANHVIYGYSDGSYENGLKGWVTG